MEGCAIPVGAAAFTLEGASRVHVAGVLRSGRKLAAAKARRAHLQAACQLYLATPKEGSRSSYNNEGLGDVLFGGTAVGEPPTVRHISSSLLDDLGGCGTGGEESERGELGELHVVR